jgi:uncharacterized repeat protein (TIGR03803 family)
VNAGVVPPFSYAGNCILRTVTLFTFGISAAAGLLAGCGGGGVSALNPSSAQHAAERRHTSVAYSVIYSFAGGNDGANPQAGLLKVKGVLYGTTESSGANDVGTVFSLTPTPSGTETTLYGFAGYPYDGADPVASLINVNGTLYGTTSKGGGGNCGIHTGCGTVFSITPSGAETILHSFGQDSAFPGAGLIKVKSTLYGTTASGGANGYGTVFAIPRFGSETTLYSFAGSPYDGANPKAGLVDVNGALYGTTYAGGANCGSSGGCGTVFAITPSGAETVLLSFAGGGDGANPPAGLIKVKSTLYGTTV